MAKNNLFLNRVSEKLLHVNTSGDGRKFMSVSFPCPESVTGFATLSVSMNQMFASTKKDGTVVNGYKNILLGKPDGERHVSIAVDTADGRAYESMVMTNTEIVARVDASRNAYREHVKAATAAVATV